MSVPVVPTSYPCCGLTRLFLLSFSSSGRIGSSSGGSSDGRYARVLRTEYCCCCRHRIHASSLTALPSFFLLSHPCHRRHHGQLVGWMHRDQSIIVSIIVSSSSENEMKSMFRCCCCCNSCVANSSHIMFVLSYSPKNH